VPLPVRIPGTRQRLRAFGEQGRRVAEQSGCAAPADLAQPIGEDLRDRSECVLVARHRSGGVDDQPDVRLLDRRCNLAGDAPRMARDRSPGCMLGPFPGASARIEPLARGALSMCRVPCVRIGHPGSGWRADSHYSHCMTDVETAAASHRVGRAAANPNYT
jgi:hypothetical protein